MESHEDLKIQKWELQIKELQLKIDHEKTAQNARKAVEESPAVKYAKKIGSNSNDWDGIFFDRKALRYAHEDGQAHATAATHEIYKPLVSALETILRGLHGQIKYSRKEIDRRICEALKNIKQPSQQFKPHPEMEEFILNHIKEVQMVDQAAGEWNSELYNNNQLAKISFTDGFRTCMKKYNLTPID